MTSPIIGRFSSIGALALGLVCLVLAGCPTVPVRDTAEQATIDALLNLVKAELDRASQAAEEAWLKGEGSEMPGAGEGRVDAAVNRAFEFTLPPELIREFFSGQLAAAVYVRSTLHAQWQAHSKPRAQAGAPAGIRPRIEASDTPLLAALSKAYPVLRKPGGRELVIERAEQLLAEVPGGAKTLTLVLVPLVSVAH